jgi:TIR domain
VGLGPRRGRARARRAGGNLGAGVPDAFKIFVNYRREDTAGHAGRLYDALAERFGDDHVFMDVDAIDPGEDFTQVVHESVGSCDVLLALIGPRWMTAADREGRRRLDNASDWVRVEIQTALDRADTRVIPTLVQGAEMPRSNDLPEGLKKLSHRNAVRLSDTGWRHDVERLIRSLEEIAGTTAPPRAAEPVRAGRPEWTRSRWFVPGLVGAALVLLAAVAAVILLSGDGGASAEERSYVRQTDLLLTNSARNRGDLNALIGNVRRQAIARTEALRQIDEIIGQRRSLVDNLPVDPPSSFEHAQGVLRESIVASLEDDIAVRAWMIAFYNGTPNEPQLFSEVARLSNVASEKKAAFLAEYNDLRDEKLDLPPTKPSY